MSDLKDMDGNTVSLLKLCSLEPEWARNRIEILQAKVEQLEAREMHVEIVQDKDEAMCDLEMRLTLALKRIAELEALLNDPLELRLYINKKLEDEKTKP